MYKGSASEILSFSYLDSCMFFYLYKSEVSYSFHLVAVVLS